AALASGVAHDPRGLEQLRLHAWLVLGELGRLLEVAACLLHRGDRRRPAAGPAQGLACLPLDLLGIRRLRLGPVGVEVVRSDYLDDLGFVGAAAALEAAAPRE